ncbi:DUF7501 family protein [Salinilacihabitans rarus]|uniref:DUF7501 family protein n=1 Tax=Salinilacihabitans rarus TaxID=2961596 RepID=UPI0020C902A7|nr:hypothetical protein [Salinilacihabitans rarus]
MAVNTTTNWSDPGTCPFCGGDLADPGAGFVDHLAESADCESSFGVWRENVAGDLAGEWSG